MGSPIAALVRAYEQRVAWARTMPHLGMPSARRGIPPDSFPAPEIADIHGRTVDKCGIGVVYDGVPTLLAAPASWNKMRKITADLIARGAHPEDIIVWDYDPSRDEITHIRTAVDHLLWTRDDQLRLDRDREDQ